MIETRTEERKVSAMRRIIAILFITSLLTACSTAGAAEKRPLMPPEHQVNGPEVSAIPLAPDQLPVSDLDTRLEDPYEREELPAAGADEAALPVGTDEDKGEAADGEAPAAPARVVDPTRPMVALTFDDGPHAVYTDQILDILEEHGAVATFFEVAQNLPKAPDAVRRAADLGCEIGSHSYRHANLGKMDQAAQQADQAAADALFQKVLGTTPTLLRPPYGSMNKTLKTTSGRSIVTWSIDPEDWLCRNADTVVSRIQAEKSLDGQVILLHSIYDSTVEATRVLVPWLLEQGYQLVTVSELIQLRFGDQVEPDRSYNYSYFRTQLPPLPTEIEPAAA